MPAADKEGKRRKRQYEPGDPYAQGYDASVDGLGKSENPHKQGSRYHDLWLAGWRVPRENTKRYCGDE